MNTTFLKVRYADTPDTKSSVIEFVNTHYQKRYNTSPPVAHAYSVVEQDKDICAVMGIEFPHEGQSFQIERTWNLSLPSLGLPISLQNGVQLSRWVSTHQAAGKLAVLAAVAYCLRLGKLYALVEHDDEVYRHCRSKLGIVFHTITHGDICLDALPEANRIWYAQGKMKPYMVELEQMKEALSIRLKSVSFEGI